MKTAAASLGHVGTAAKDVIPALVAALGDEDDRLRRAAAESLGKNRQKMQRWMRRFGLE